MRTLADVSAGAAPGAQSSLLKLKGTEIVQRMTEFFVECAGPYAAPWFPEVSGPPQTVGPEWARPEMVRYLEARARRRSGARGLRAGDVSSACSHRWRTHRFAQLAARHTAPR